MELGFSSSPPSSSIDVCSQTIISYVSVYHLDCAGCLEKSYQLLTLIERNQKYSISNNLLLPPENCDSRISIHEIDNENFINILNRYERI